MLQLQGDPASPPAWGDRGSSPLVLVRAQADTKGVAGESKASAVRPDSWFAKLLNSLWAGVVQDVPRSLEECESCREVDSTQERWESCERRIAAQELVLGCSATQPLARTDELAAMPEPGINQPGPSDGETARTGEGRQSGAPESLGAIGTAAPIRSPRSE